MNDGHRNHQPLSEDKPPWHDRPTEQDEATRHVITVIAIILGAATAAILGATTIVLVNTAMIIATVFVSRKANDTLIPPRERSDAHEARTRLLLALAWGNLSAIALIVAFMVLT